MGTRADFLSRRMRALDNPASVRAEREAARARPGAPEQSAAPVLAIARTTPRALDRMNKTERRYSAYLDALRSAGQVAWWGFEVVTLRLADSTHYRTDFTLVLATGSIEIHDVKGRKGASYHIEEDANVKIKCAAELFPFTFRIVWEAGGGTWHNEEV